MTQGLLGTSPGCHDLTCTNKMKTYKYNTVGTVPTSNRKIVERDKIDTHNTHIQDHSLS